MKKVHINFAIGGRNFEYKQVLNSESALNIGGFNETIKYGFSDIDKDFYEKNIHIFSQERGFGFWIWKPYFISDTLKKMNYGDILCYTDSGCLFIKSFNPFIEKIQKDEKGVILFELNSNFFNAHVTKRDCFYYMNCDNDYYHNSIMTLASFIIIKKTDFSISFVDEWLEYSQDYRILTDSPNECGLPNLDSFVDHRHDQSILSLLSKKYNISVDIDPSQYGNDRRDSSEQLINHTR